MSMSFLVNSPAAVQSIERADTEALDLADVARFWKVYTTTKRRLHDPTAERLENYWWRLWGSRKRELKGTTVARLFAQISNAQTFRPLRRPSSRDEVTPPSGRNTRLRPGASSSTTLHRPAQARPSTTSSSALSRTPTVMPHPILKKARGPSTTGPRPTARFISPQETPHESEQETEPDSPVDLNSHVVVQPPTPNPENSKVDRKVPVPATGKKKSGVVASTAAKKKRPVLPRRQSSQTSQPATDLPHHAGLSQRAPHTTSEHKAQSKPPVSSKFQENFSPSSRNPSNAVQKNQVFSKGLESARKASVQRGQSSKSQQAEAGPSSQRLRPAENGQDIAEDLTAEELEELELQKALLKEANASMKKPPRVPSQMKSDSESKDRVRFQHDSKDTGGIKLLPHDVKGTTSLASTSVNASGHLDLKAPDADKMGTPSLSSHSASKGKGKNRDPDDLPPAGMFSKRPVQVTVAAESTGPLSRSKSQLTLLLETNQARGSDNISGKKG